jgi:hypothetical protein
MRTMTMTMTLGGLAARTGLDVLGRLALGALVTAGVAYLVHPEHGGSGIAPGRYVIRRQRERSDRWRQGRAYQLIAD